jgi:hypothetical protein
LVEFRKYTHVRRIDECPGLLDDVVTVSPKLDGSNGCVWYDKGQDRVCVGSRKRVLGTGEQEDNAGCARFVLESDDPEAVALRLFAEENPGLIVYFEWLVKHNIGSYSKDAWKHCWVFDVYDTVADRYCAQDDVLQKFRGTPVEPYVVPVLATLDNPTVDNIAEVAKHNKFLLEDSPDVGEGVVVRRRSGDFKDEFGEHVIGKLVLDEFKDKKRRKKVQAAPDDVEALVCDMYVTDYELSKTVAKTREAMGCTEGPVPVRDNRFVSRYMATVWHDLLADETVNFVKKLKNPTVDFAKLKGEVDSRARKYLGF